MEKILIVDDDASIATYLEEQVSFMGYEVVGRASSGELATDMAKRFKPDLILMDIVMPGKIDGIEASEIIKEKMDIPTVFLTAYGDDKFIKRAKLTEPYGYIIKPVLENELKATIEIALYKKNIEQKQKEIEELLFSLTENIDEGVILCDSSGKVFFWNKMAETIFGYSADEMKGKLLPFIWCEEIRETYQKEINQVISTEKSKIAEKRVDIFGLRKDRSKFPMELFLTPLRIRDRLYFICITRDTTNYKSEESRLKASIREKELLLEEIHNRTKDNLQVVYNLLNLQSRYIKDKEALTILKNSSDRARSVALIYEKLYQFKDPAGIDFANYIRNLVARLFHSYGVNTNLIKQKINVDNIFMDVRTAVPCGLIISELVSNSLKYAFPDKKQGEICIEFLLDKEKQLRLLIMNKYTVVVSDNGVGFPKDLDFRNTKSLGLQLVNDLVHQLNGLIKLRRKGGTKFMISFETIKHKKQY